MLYGRVCLNKQGQDTSLSKLKKEVGSMVDNRAAGFYGVAGAFNFKSGDISGTAAKTSDDRASQGTEYALIDTAEEEQTVNTNKYIDNSAQLNATLNSLAMMNVASVINSKLPKYNPAGDLKKLLEEAESIVSSVSLDEKNNRKHHSDKEEKEKQEHEEEENEYY